MVLIKSNFEATLQPLKPDVTQITYCRNVVSIKDMASTVFVAFWPVLPFRERKNFTHLS